MNKKQLIISSIIVVVLAVVVGIIGFKLGRGKDDAEPKEQTVADGSAGKEQDTDDKKPGKTEDSVRLAMNTCAGIHSGKIDPANAVRGENICVQKKTCNDIIN